MLFLTGRFRARLALPSHGGASGWFNRRRSTRSTKIVDIIVIGNKIQNRDLFSLRPGCR